MHKFFERYVHRLQIGAYMISVTNLRYEMHSKQLTRVVMLERPEVWNV